uniref:ASPIC/UnbV domain-containing protein n=1 Tax=Rhodosorus marinus TaxID=101924 RepID=A0A7S2ZZP0_9RHOD|mmetsp:Transcript_39184/g.155407  ORF Transcript_39184/g.155407 Transcript_39184/m.155407 type:complete len:560 (+) Transcript_39184:80-1759(+)
MGRLSVLAIVYLLVWVGCEGAMKPVFKDVSKLRGIQTLEENHRRRPEDSKYFGATIADLDCDGRYDLVLSNHGNNAEWYWSKGTKQFTYTDPELRNHDVHGTAAGDLDNDGIKDVIFTLGGSGGAKPGLPIFYHVSKNRTYKKDRGEKWGLDQGKTRGRTATYIDIDNDGDLDLIFLSAPKLDSNRSHYVYENLGNGQFRLRNKTGLERIFGFKHLVLDINNDGNLDLIVFDVPGPDVYLGTGRFKFNLNKKILPDINLRLVASMAEFDYDGDGDFDLYLSRGFPGKYEAPNILLENRDGKYVAVEKKTRSDIVGHSRHVTYGDFNNDGFIDLYITETVDKRRTRKNDIMLVNQGGKQFVRQKRTGTESKNPYEDGNNSIAFDYDNDGRVDILSGARNGTWNLYENRTPYGARHYILVQVGRPSARVLNKNLKRSPMHAVVRVVTSTRVFIRRVSTPGRSHAQAFMDTLHFGLGQRDKIERITIDYNGGVRVVREGGIKVDSTILIGRQCNCSGGKTGPNCALRKPECSMKSCAGTRCETTFFTDNPGKKYYCKVPPGQ